MTTDNNFRKYEGNSLPVFASLELAGVEEIDLITHRDDWSGEVLAKEARTIKSNAALPAPWVSARRVAEVFNPEGICLADPDSDEEEWDAAVAAYCGLLGFVRITSVFSDGERREKYHLVVNPDHLEVYNKKVGYLSDEEILD